MNLRQARMPAIGVVIQMFAKPGAVFSLAFFLFCGGCVSQLFAQQRIGGSAREALAAENVATFDAVWSIIHEMHYDTNFNGVDWTAARKEFRPQAKMARDRSELRSVIGQMLDRLGQSHTAVIPAESAELFDPEAIERKRKEGSANPDKSQRRSGGETEGESGLTDTDTVPTGDGNFGFDVRLREDAFVVVRVDSGGAADRAGVKPGWALRAIDDELLAPRLEKLPNDITAQKRQFLAWRMVSALLAGRPGSQAVLTFADGTDRVVMLDLKRQRPAGQRVKLGHLPPLYAHMESRWMNAEPRKRIGLIHFNLWMIPIAAQFDRAIDEFRDADGIIIDLRGNLGGIGGMIIGFAGHFLSERVSLGTMKMRANELHFNANPRFVNAAERRVEPYSGPVAILTDAITLSAAEVFAGGMQSIGRAKVFGETTGGQALPAMWHRLPNGDVLYYAFADFVTPDGVRLEGRGVIPDVPAPLQREDLLAGRDRALELAIAWMTEKVRIDERNASRKAPSKQ